MLKAGLCDMIDMVHIFRESEGETEMKRPTFAIITGDITKIEADAIVNPTDSSCSGLGGIDRAIQNAAGAELKRALQANRRFEDGDAIITPAFGIKTAKWIIHSVGPRWKAGFDHEEYKLAQCYRNSLRLAIDHKCHSIAFPCISTGANGFPPDRAAEIAVRTVAYWLQNNREDWDDLSILFVCPEKYAEIYKTHLKKAIIDDLLYWYSPESLPYPRSDIYYAHMRKLAVLEWGEMSCHHKYHNGFTKPAQTLPRGAHSEYDMYAQNMNSWDYNTCLAYIIEIFRSPYSYDGTGLIVPHFEQTMNGAVRRVLLRMRSLLG